MEVVFLYPLLPIYCIITPEQNNALAENVLPVAQTNEPEQAAENVLPVAQSEPMPCYLHDFTYAKEHDEVDAYKRNAEENRKCREAISKAISDNYDISKYSFDSDTAWNTLTESFAPERITMILSANIARIADFDGRISPEIKAWAKEQYALIPEEIQKSIQELTLSENPGLLDIMGRHIIDVLPVAQSQEPPKIEAATDTDAAAKKKAGRRLENRAYKALQKLAPEMFGDDCTYLRFESKQYEPLVIEKIDTDKISIAHYYEQNGDLMRDPEIVFTVDAESSAIYPLEFTQDNLGIYQYYNSYTQDSRELLSFFVDEWASNLEKQNHSLAKAIYDFNGSEVTVQYRPDGTISGADADNPEIAAAFLTSRNFTITDEKYDYRIPEDSYGIGTKRDRCHDNIEAIRTLKAIEADERMATPEEQEILAKYVGWGGIQEVFDANNGAILAATDELQALKEQMGKKFPLEEELAAKTARLSELNQKLTLGDRDSSNVLPVAQSEGEALKPNVMYENLEKQYPAHEIAYMKLNSDEYAALQKANPNIPMVTKPIQNGEVLVQYRRADEKLLKAVILPVQNAMKNTVVLK